MPFRCAEWAARTSFKKGGALMGKRVHAGGAIVVKSAFDMYFKTKLERAMAKEKEVARDASQEVRWLCLCVGA